MLQRLDMSVGFGWSDEYDPAIKDLDALFCRLAPSLRHLHIRLVCFEHPRTAEISNHILGLIPNLLSLTSLGIGGDIALGYESPTRPGFAPLLASLPIADLRLYISSVPPFAAPSPHKPDVVDLVSVLRLSGAGGLERLRRLTVEYGAETGWIPVELVRVCKDRRIDLRLSKVDELD